MNFLAKSEILVKFAPRDGFETFLYIVELKPTGPKYRSDSIRNGKSTPKMYFQAAYIDGNFWKISTSVSPFVKANLAFGLIYEVESRAGYPEMSDQSTFWGFFIYILLLNVK